MCPKAIVIEMRYPTIRARSLKQTLSESSTSIIAFLSFSTFGNALENHLDSVNDVTKPKANLSWLPIALSLVSLQAGASKISPLDKTSSFSTYPIPSARNTVVNINEQNMPHTSISVTRCQWAEQLSKYTASSRRAERQHSKGKIPSFSVGKQPAEAEQLLVMLNYAYVMILTFKIKCEEKFTARN